MKHNGNGNGNGKVPHPPVKEPGIDTIRWRLIKEMTLERLFKRRLEAFDSAAKKAQR